MLGSPVGWTGVYERTRSRYTPRLKDSLLTCCVCVLTPSARASVALSMLIETGDAPNGPAPANLAVEAASPLRLAVMGDGRDISS